MRPKSEIYTPKRDDESPLPLGMLVGFPVGFLNNFIVSMHFSEISRVIIEKKTFSKL